MEKEIICIVCPRGCHVKVNDIEGEITFSNYTCSRGPEYVKKELTAPTRMLTTTVKIDNAIVNRLSVVSSSDIPKEMIIECIKALANVVVTTPIKAGDIIVPNILGLKVDILATKSLEEKTKYERSTHLKLSRGLK